MKKFILITLAAALGLMLSGCNKVEPTSLSYKYSVSVSGKVTFNEESGNGADGIEVSLSVTGAPHSTYRATTNGSGNYSITIPSTGKGGISVTASVKESIRGNYKYSSKESKTGSAEGNKSITDLNLVLSEGVSIND